MNTIFIDGYGEVDLSTSRHSEVSDETSEWVQAEVETIIREDGLESLELSEVLKDLRQSRNWVEVAYLHPVYGGPDRDGIPVTVRGSECDWPSPVTIQAILDGEPVTVGMVGETWDGRRWVEGPIVDLAKSIDDAGESLCIEIDGLQWGAAETVQHFLLLECVD